MGDLTWLLEPEVFQNDLGPFIEKLGELGEQYQTLKFGMTYECCIQSYEFDQKVVFHGSYQFAKLIKHSTQWGGVFCNFNRFNCLYYYPRFGNCLLNSNYIMLPYGAIEERHFEDCALFLKPSNFKLFTGQVVNKTTWQEFKKKMDFKLNPEELIVLAPVTEILKEWRAVVFKNEIISICQYKDGSQTVRIKDVPVNIIEYGNAVLQKVKFNPDPIWVMDICETENGLSILEVGPFACCGLYSCQPEPIIKAVKQFLGG